MITLCRFVFGRTGIMWGWVLGTVVVLVVLTVAISAVRTIQEALGHVLETTPAPEPAIQG